MILYLTDVLEREPYALDEECRRTALLNLGVAVHNLNEAAAA
jgi:hypothetical protein